MSKAVRHGLYLVYVKNGMVYPIGMTLDQWQILQALGNSLAGNPIQVFPEPMGKAENLAKKRSGESRLNATRSSYAKMRLLQQRNKETSQGRENPDLLQQ